MGRIFGSAAYVPTAAYRRLKISGFEVLVAPDLPTDHSTTLRLALDLLEQKLNDVNRLVPTKASAVLRGISFWLEWARDEHGAQYHPFREYLVQNGINPDKWRCVEISNLRHFVDWAHSNQPMMVLHELAHGYHQQVLGFDDPTVRAAYNAAVASGKYDSVPYNLGGRRKAYGMENEREYFAEQTEAYFGDNDFYPFNRKELAAFDPQGFAMIESSWHVGSGKQ